MKTLTLFVFVIALATISPAQPDDSITLYVHFGTAWGDSSNRLLSTQVRLGEPIFVEGSDYWKLTGRVERQGTNLVANLVGSTGGESDHYKGSVTLEKPFFAQGGGASGFVGEPRWFCVSTNSDCGPLLRTIKGMAIGRPKMGENK